jgi:hypothetical protein
MLSGSRRVFQAKGKTGFQLSVVIFNRYFPPHNPENYFINDIKMLKLLGFFKRDFSMRW